MLLDVDEASLARLCHNFKDEDSHPISIDELLPPHSTRLIEDGNRKDLGKLYHNLCTEPTAQKNAL